MTCQTCGGTRNDPGGLPVCRECGPQTKEVLILTEAEWRKMFDDEIELLRRNPRKYESDFTEFSIEQQWKSYRRALRLVGVVKE